jgi:predicted NodU family carbamoyl transferase
VVSHTYKANESASEELREESARLARSLNEAQPDFVLKVLNAAPTKTRAGMLVYADGVNWNPGAGEGLYRRDKTNASWVFIG